MDVTVVLHLTPLFNTAHISLLGTISGSSSWFSLDAKMSSSFLSTLPDMVLLPFFVGCQSYSSLNTCAVLYLGYLCVVLTQSSSFYMMDACISSSDSHLPQLLQGMHEPLNQSLLMTGTRQEKQQQKQSILSIS